MMTVFLYVVLNVTSAFAPFIMNKKKLHILEIMMYWIVASYMFQNFSALCYMNFKTLLMPDKLSFALMNFLNRIILYPALMVVFLRLYVHVKTYVNKCFLIAVCVCLFVGLEFVGDDLGYLIHAHWRIWWSFSFWLGALLLLVGWMAFFRKVLYRGEIK